jgi:hypothetical protein
MWRSVALGVVLAGVLAGCNLGGGGGASQPSSVAPRPELVISVQRFVNGSPNTTRYTLDCSPPSGTHPDPVAACRAVAAITQLGSRAHLGGCVGVYPGPEVTVTGTYAGRSVRLHYGWLCGITPMSLIPELRALGTYRASE